MEMNTRLQVEHPVTEAITGLDLVELQLRVASGEPLGLVQEDIKFSGHAIEVRLCSEDADHDFMPQSGTMALWQMPDGVRVEHALQSGSEIPPFYDSMIAKIISHGADRNEARGRLICGLEQTAAFGVTTNQGFLISCLRHPGFRQGRGDHGVHRQASRRIAGAACESDGGSRAGRVAALRHQSPCAALAQRAHVWRRRFRCRCGSISAMARRKSTSCASATAAMSPSSMAASYRFEIDELGGDTIRFRTRRHDGIGEIPARWRPAVCPASRRARLRSAI